MPLKATQEVAAAFLAEQEAAEVAEEAAEAAEEEGHNSEEEDNCLIN